MRLTVELEDDIIEYFNQEKLRTGQSMKEIVNRALRDDYARLALMRQVATNKMERKAG